MNWYAIQVMSGKEDDVRKALNDYGIETILPYKPIFLRHAGTLDLIQRPVMPGYIIARLDLIDFFQCKHCRHLEKTMIRVCGTGSDAVPLTSGELSFFQSCCAGITPLQLKAEQVVGSDLKKYRIINPPPWADSLSVDWYDICKFAAKLHIQSNGILKDHFFKIAAFNIDYRGIYQTQLKDLLSTGFGQSGSLLKKVVIEN